MAVSPPEQLDEYGYPIEAPEEEIDQEEEEAPQSEPVAVQPQVVAPTAVQPAVASDVSFPAGTGQGWTTTGPGSKELRSVTLPSGRVIQVPVNATNIWEAKSPVVEPGSMDAFWRQMKSAYGSLPIEQASQAITAAMKFQGVRGFQRDLQNGMSNTDAWAKWAPMMFAGTKTGIAAPRAVTQPRPFALQSRTGPNNSIWVIDPNTGETKQAVSGSPAVDAAEKTRQSNINKLGLVDYNRLSQELKNAKAAMVDPNNTAPVEERQAAVKAIEDQLAGVATGLTNAPAATQPTAAPSTKRIRVKKGGKVGTIPESQLAQALKEGYEQVK